jgi:hypothetical protein
MDLGFVCFMQCPSSVAWLIFLLHMQAMFFFKSSTGSTKPRGTGDISTGSTGRACARAGAGAGQGGAGSAKAAAPAAVPCLAGMGRPMQAKPLSPPSPPPPRSLPGWGVWGAGSKPP